MPADLPHWRTVYHYVLTWQETGATRRMHDQLREAVRVLAGRGPQPTAAIIDSQSVKAADTVGKDSRGKLVTWAAGTLYRTVQIVRRLIWKLSLGWRGSTWSCTFLRIVIIFDVAHRMIQ